MYDSVIIGAGFFGLYLAQHLSVHHKQKILVIEKNKYVMTRASYVNQARVHNGYHYPRNLLTARRSRQFFPRFIEEFKDAIVDDFDKYYAVGNILGKISSSQFYHFCKSIGIPIEVASPNIKKYFDKQLIDEVFFTDEVAFDSKKLNKIILNRIDSKSVEINTSEEVSNVCKDEGELKVQTNKSVYSAKNVYNCTYSQINKVLYDSGLSLLPLKHEITEICLVKMPKELKNFGLTVMCGPFFSTMPFPSEELHSFSHVRYTPHCEYYEDINNYCSPHDFFKNANLRTQWNKMVTDAKRYMPILQSCEYQKSLFEVKTVLPRNEANDGRPILYQPNHNLEGFHCIMGGKIDNVYDMISLTEELLGKSS